MNNDSDSIREYLTALEHVRYEGQLLWQIFGAFLVAHTVFLAFLLQATFGGEQVVQYRLGTFIGGFIGFLLCIPWMASYFRSSAYYIFRMLQAREKEPSEWNLIKGKGEDFSAGKCVTVSDETCQVPWIARLLPTKRSVPLLIIVFAVVYATVVIVSGPCWPK